MRFNKRDVVPCRVLAHYSNRLNPIGAVASAQDEVSGVSCRYTLFAAAGGRLPLILAMLALAASVRPVAARAAEEDLAARVEHHDAVNATDQVKIHYVSIGQGPLVVFLHGFPDCWFGWAHQIDKLAGEYRCVAMDLRGYNRSDKPTDTSSYDLSLLVQDVMAVINDCGAKSATVVGHDWGGILAWSLAMSEPDYVDNLVICNLPHPRGLKRELLINDEHRANTQYARDFQDPDYHKRLSPAGVVMLLKTLTQGEWSETKSEQYLGAMERGDFRAMLNYYRQNYNPVLEEKPTLPYEDPSEVEQVKAPVLIFHGLKDKALHHHALNNTWEWVEQDLTILTVPEAGHWVHHDSAELVSNTLYDWLARRR